MVRQTRAAIWVGWLLCCAGCDEGGEGDGGEGSGEGDGESGAPGDEACADIELPGEVAYASTVKGFVTHEGVELETLLVTNASTVCGELTDATCHPSGIAWQFAITTTEPWTVGPFDFTDVAAGGNEIRMDPDTCAPFGPLEELCFDRLDVEIVSVSETCVAGRMTFEPTMYPGVEGAEAGEVWFAAPRC